MTDATDQEQRPEHLFKPGQSGNPKGRPKGSRNKLGEKFVSDLQADWEEHGVAAIKAVRSEKPDAYLKVIASILPKEHIVRAPTDEMSDDELAERIGILEQLVAVASGRLAGSNGRDGDAGPSGEGSGEKTRLQ